MVGNLIKHLTLFVFSSLLNSLIHFPRNTALEVGIKIKEHNECFIGFTEL